MSLSFFCATRGKLARSLLSPLSEALFFECCRFSAFFVSRESKMRGERKEKRAREERKKKKGSSLFALRCRRRRLFLFLRVFSRSFSPFVASSSFTQRENDSAGNTCARVGGRASGQALQSGNSAGKIKCGIMFFFLNAVSSVSFVLLSCDGGAVRRRSTPSSSRGLSPPPRPPLPPPSARAASSPRRPGTPCRRRPPGRTAARTECRSCPRRPCPPARPR